MSRARELAEFGGVISVDDTAVVVNEGGNDVDFRVEGDTNANLLFVDASADKVGIGTNTPTSTLHLSSAAASTYLQVTNTSGSPGNVFLGTEGGLNYLISRDSGSGTQPLAIFTGTSERMRISSAGEVLVGGTTALYDISGMLSIQRTDAAAYLNLYRNDTSITTGNQFGFINFFGNDTTSNTPTPHAQIYAAASGTHAAGDNPTDLVFGVTNDGSATVYEAARFTYAGNLKFPNGQGIDFSASEGGGATSSILDDYEEGNWTPSIEGASTAGTTTYGANRLGWYRKIGSQVTVYYYIQVSATTGSGSLRISNLPFTTASSGIQSVGSVMTYLLNWTGSTTSIATYADGNRNYLLLYISGDDVSWANQLLTNETFELIGTHTYFA